MTTGSKVLEIGRIAKSHGLRGEVIVELFTNRNERLSPGAEFSAPGGYLKIVRSAAHQHRWIVKFDGVDTREKADALRGTILSAEPLEDPDALWIHELIGSEVHLLSDESRVGKVTAVLANPAGDILEVNRSILVPLRFVVKTIDGVLFIDPPAGLLEINEPE